MARPLRELIPDLVTDYVWGLLRQGREREAATMLKEYLPRYPLNLTMLKLMLRTRLSRLAKR